MCRIQKIASKYFIERAFTSIIIVFEGLEQMLLSMEQPMYSPTESKLISQEELIYIESSKSAIKAANDSESEVKIPVPWKAIMSSLPFWALVVARSAQSWGFSTLQAEIPSYMNGLLQMNMKSNALFSALPYLAMWCMSYIYLISSDILLNNKVLSLTAILGTNAII